MEIQLVIKAPNQNIEDHIVHCNVNWTIEQLKNHLSYTYPNTPQTEDQKLIYSGRMLSNHLQLKDILRQEDGQPPVYTFHLVCNSIPYHNQSSSSGQNQTNSTDQISTETANPTQSPENILRHRNRTLPPTSLVYPQMNQGLAQAPILPDAQVAAQMAAMQQMYNYYLAQYMQSTPAPQPPVAPPAQQPQPQAPPPEEGPEEGAARDWLDQAFSCVRFVMLIFVVYLYSTPERMMLVVAVSLVVILYQEGWFTRRRPPAAPDALPDNSDTPEEVERDNEALDEHELAAAMDGDDPPHVRADPTRDDPPFSPLALVATFFTSLFPDPPPHLNIN